MSSVWEATRQGVSLAQRADLAPGGGGRRGHLHGSGGGVFVGAPSGKAGSHFSPYLSGQVLLNCETPRSDTSLLTRCPHKWSQSQEGVLAIRCFPVLSHRLLHRLHTGAAAAQVAEDSEAEGHAPSQFVSPRSAFLRRQLIRPPPPFDATSARGVERPNQRGCVSVETI